MPGFFIFKLLPHILALWLCEADCYIRRDVMMWNGSIRLVDVIEQKQHVLLARVRVRGAHSSRQAACKGSLANGRTIGKGRGARRQDAFAMCCQREQLECHCCVC